MKPLERRLVSLPVEVRAVDGQPVTVRGYAAIFNTEAVIAGMFRERIAPGAFRSVIGAGADVRALFNHDDNIVLGRTTNGTLRLSEDARGLAYDVTPNHDDSDAMNVVAKIKRGDVSQSSYGFRVKADEWTKPTRAGELPLRTINEFEALRDVSPVTFPAFEETTAEARSAAEAMRAMMPDDDTPAETVEEAACLAACQACIDACAACITACSPLLFDEDSGSALRECVRACASSMQTCGRAMAVMQGQDVYSYYSGALANEHARLDLLALD